MSATVRIEDGVPWVGDRSYAWAAKVRNDDRRSAGIPWRTRHFWLTFENGWTLSVTWGTGTYGSNRDSDWGRHAEFQEAAPHVEIAAWPMDGEMVEWDDGDTVKGWVGADDLNRLIDAMKDWPSQQPAGFVASLPQAVAS